MAEEAKPVEQKAPEAGTGDGVEKGNEGVPLQAEPDWKELLRLERGRSEKMERERDNYKEGLLSRKRQERIQRDEQEDEPSGDDKIKAAVAEALAPVVSALKVNKVDQILGSVVEDPSKREYVKSIYQSRIQKTGDSDEAIREDINTALALADSTKFAKENEELKRLKENGHVYVPPNGGGGTSDRGVEQKAYKWTPEQERSLEQRAMMNGITDVEKYKALAWKASQEGSAFDLKKKYI